MLTDAIIQGFQLLSAKLEVWISYKDKLMKVDGATCLAWKVGDLPSSHAEVWRALIRFVESEVTDLVTGAYNRKPAACHLGKQPARLLLFSRREVALAL